MNNNHNLYLSTTSNNNQAQTCTKSADTAIEQQAAHTNSQLHLLLCVLRVTYKVVAIELGLLTGRQKGSCFIGTQDQTGDQPGGRWVGSVEIQATNPRGASGAATLHRHRHATECWLNIVTPDFMSTGVAL